MVTVPAQGIRKTEASETGEVSRRDCSWEPGRKDRRETTAREAGGRGQKGATPEKSQRGKRCDNRESTLTDEEYLRECPGRKKEM